MFLTLQLRQGRPALDSAFENSGAGIRVETPQCWKCESVAFWSAFKKIDLGNNSKPVSSSFLPWGLLSHEGLANSCGSLVWVESEFCASNHATAIWTQERNTSQTQVRESATESATERATWQNTFIQLVISGYFQTVGSKGWKLRGHHDLRTFRLDWRVASCKAASWTRVRERQRSSNCERCFFYSNTGSVVNGFASKWYQPCIQPVTDVFVSVGISKDQPKRQTETLMTWGPHPLNRLYSEREMCYFRPELALAACKLMSQTEEQRSSNCDCFCLFTYGVHSISFMALRQSDISHASSQYQLTRL